MRIYKAFGLLLLPLIVNCQFLSAPVLRSNRTLPGNSTFRQGNGIVAANNSNHVVMTSSDGRLHIVTIKYLISKNGTLDEDDNDVLVYIPTAESTDRELTCNSNPVLVETESTSYAIYSYTESQSGNDHQSQIVAVKLEDASMLWGVTVPGKVIGNPLVSTNFRHVYIIHNVYDSDRRQDDGRISVITIESNRQASLSVTFPSQSTGAPFAPGALQTFKTRSSPNVQEGSDTYVPPSTYMSDFVFFGQRLQDGYSRRGSLYSLVVRDEIQQSSTYQTFPAQLLLVSDFPGSGITAPVVSSSLQVYLGTAQSYLLGYTDGRDFSTLLEESVSVNTDDDSRTENDPTDIVSYRNANQLPRWIVPLEQNIANGLAPIAGTPILSSDGRYVYVAAAGDEIACIDQTQGQNAGTTWTYSTQGVQASTPVYHVLPNRSGDVVYFIERDTGIVRQFESIQGSLLWETGESTPVEADATTAQNGTLFVYGDVKGQIVVLSVVKDERPEDDIVRKSPSPSKSPKRSKTTVPTARKRVNTTAPSIQVTSVINTTTTGTEGGTNENSTDTSRDSTQVDTTVSNPIDSSVTSNELKSKTFKSVVLAQLPYILGGACGVILLLILFILCIKRRRKKIKEVLVSAESDKQREEEDTARLYELTRMKVEKECEDEERETLDAIFSSSAPKLRSKEINNTPNTSLNDDSITSQNLAPQDLDEFPTDCSKTEAGFEISPDDYSVSESLNDMSSLPSEYSPSILSPTPNQKNQSQSIAHMDALTPPLVSSQFSIGSLSPRRNMLPESSLEVPSLLPPLISAATSQDEIDTLARTLSSGHSHSGGENNDKTDSFMWKVAAVLSKSTVYPVSDESKILDSGKKQPLDGGDDEDEASEIEGFSNFMGNIATPQHSRHQRQPTQKQIARDQTPDSPIEVTQTVIKADIRKLTSSKPNYQLSLPSPSDNNSVDDSLYLDESTIEPPIDEADVGAGSALFDDLPSSEHKRVDTIVEGPDDEPPATLKPGSQYYERHSRYGHATDSISEEIRRSLDRNKIRPTYKGVSVRPSRAKAGLFSRRIGSTGRPSDSDDDAGDGNFSSQVKQSVKSPVIPIPAVPKKVKEPLVEPSPASFYVEKTEAAARKAENKDTKTEWNSFLQELSDVESQFYSPRSPSRNHDNVEIQQPIRPNRFSTSNGIRSRMVVNSNDDYESDSSSDHEAPPPPRTFFA